ncbi:secretion protein HlyD [Methylobacter sp.]|uniref:secretion protein HlyD n=1 Tax=Methylobacter sp. TaxID=2051955 RepID=UPI002FDEAF0E
MKKVISAVIILFAVVGIGLFYHKYHSDTERAMVLYGNVDIREVNLGFRVAGRLSQLVYDEGNDVRIGEVIARLDDEPYRNQVAIAAAQVKSLKERLRLKETGNRPQEIAQARSLVREREATAANAKRLFERSEKTLDSKGISAQDRDNAEANYREVEARLMSARQNLALLEAGFRVEDIAQAKADLAQAEAALASAELQVKDAILIAPSDGVILTRAQEVGSILSAGATVFTVSLQNPVWVRAYLHEPDLGRIHPGTQVDIYTDSRLDKPYSGHIGYISPRAEFTPKAVETTELRSSLVYRFRIVVDNPDQMLRQGMPVTIKLAANSPATPLQTNHHE